jgi:hypothetical protein
VTVVEHGGLVLMARPMALHEKAQEQERRDAATVLANLRRKHGDGDLGPNVPSEFSRHPSARRSNKHVRTLERITIPTDDEWPQW